MLFYSFLFIIFQRLITIYCCHENIIIHNCPIGIGHYRLPKQQADVSAELDPAVKAQFEQSDARLSAYLDKLDSSTISLEERTHILCEDYPKEYKTHYMPALIKLMPQEYDEQELLKDLKMRSTFIK